MRKKGKIFFLRETGALLCLMAVAGVLFSAGRAGGTRLKRHRYRQTEGKETFHYIREEDHQDPMTVRVMEPENTFITVCNSAGQTFQWQFINTHTRITAKRNKDTIHLTGTFKGRPIDKRVSVGELSWYQAAPNALGHMAATGKAEDTFWMIRPDTLKLLRLKACRLEPEAITVGGRRVLANKVRITLTGLLEKLWRAHYWFRRSDGVFLQYKGVNGPPGTPETLIQLVD